MKSSIWTSIALLLALAGTAQAQAPFPNRPITLVVGSAPGGGLDTVGRIFGEALGNELGQPILVVNRPGAGTTMGAESVARSPADGYTLLLASASLFGGDQYLYKTARYEPKDFLPITRVSSAALLLSVNKNSGLTSVADLVAKARQAPGKYNFSTGGAGTIIHVAAVHFMDMAKVQMTHVPYKGGGPSSAALAAGDVHLSFATAASVKPMVAAGKVDVLAVTSATRFPLEPNYPSIAEAGVPGYDIQNFFGIFAPAGVPQAVADRLFAASVKVLNDPDMKQKLALKGENASPSASMAEFREFALREGQRSAALLKQSGAKAD